ncbi:MAG TPA: glutamate--tRNA ligase [Vitreimonas sp.]|uniref:glutamate--tRNA ligase n=1 Tax=Vitreimonas sp. TaxID=3069702 RepID=UPI002D4952BF|nr:glutamate--tRNA ligase [Vitreimonas sp.]HYD86806.1 glutamate--tRNA ligase [Vitreimonas sp.]
MSIRLRFAPSPTGRIHVGNVRTALMNWLFAIREGGQVLLRIDDTDLARSTKAYEQSIVDDLAWLGLAWSERANQSHRFDAYEKAAAKLKADGLLYPAYETEEELDRKRKIAQATGKPPVYDRAALNLTDTDRAKLEGEGRKPHWRFKLSGARKDWVDLVRGPQSIDTASLSDPVLIREDGAFLYTLPSVVDDIDFNITHIVRGEDHVTNSGVQIEIFEALGGSVPAFGHFPLLVGADGGALSKRIGSLGVGELAAEGYEPMAVLSHLAKIGTSDPVEARLAIDELAAEFDFAKIGRAPARFDPEELKRVNAAVLHQLDYTSVKDRLANLEADRGESFWLAIRANIQLLPEARQWAHVVDGPIEPFISDKTFAAAALEALPKGAYDASSWSAFTNAVKEKTGAKGKALFMPLRQALTGLDHGPEMAPLFALIGEERARKRLSGQAA